MGGYSSILYVRIYLLMKLVKIFGVFVGLAIFLLLSNLDRRYPQASNPVLDSNWIKSVYGIDNDELIAGLGAKFISVSFNGDIQYFLTNSPTPVDALLDNGYSVSNMNRIVTTSPLNALSSNSFIILQTYTTTVEDITIYVPYERVIQGTTLCEKLSEEVIQQKGVLGATTQTIKKSYVDGELVATEVVDEVIQRAPINEIIILQGPDDTPDQVPQVEAKYPCDYWGAYIDNVVLASDEEKQWLKFTMKWESGCNAGSNNGYYKGLFQWDPCLWYEQFPNDNIFDGTAQITRTLWKIHMGGNPKYMWPAVYKKYVAEFGELSWLSN